jgi:hypothetical protein
MTDDDYEFVTTEAATMSINAAIKLLQAGKVQQAERLLLELNFELEQDLAVMLLIRAEDDGEPYELH